MNARTSATRTMRSMGAIPRLSSAVDDSALGQIVRRKGHGDFIAQDDADEKLPHFAGNVGEDVLTGRDFHPKHTVREDFFDHALALYLIVFRHCFSNQYYAR